jgi:hypothetical protein
MSGMIAQMQDPSYKTKIESAMKGLKDDPELKPILEELETSGPMGMMKCVFPATAILFLIPEFASLSSNSFFLSKLDPKYIYTLSLSWVT